MGVRRVYYDPRREIRVNVLAVQTKSSAIQEGGRSGSTFPGKHLMLTSRDEMDHQLQVDELPGIKVQKLDGLFLRLLKSLPRSLVEGLPWMEPMSTRDLEVVYDRLITNHLVTPGLAYLPPGVLSTSLELEPEMGIFLWNMILGGMPMEGLIWTTLIGRDVLNDVMHPDAIDYYLHPEGRAHALMFPLVYLLQQFLTPEGTSETMRRPRFKDGDGDVNDAQLSQLCSYVGVTSFRFMEFMDAFTTEMKKRLTTLSRNIFSKYGFNTKDSSLKQFRAPNHPLWGTCLTVSLVRAGKQRIFVRLPMDNRYTNPVTGCRAVLMDTSLAYEPGLLVPHAQTQQQDGAVEITSATAVPEELLLEHDWWIRNEWKVEDARVMYEILAQHIRKR
eukprot:4253611-Amphidinium_carterae.8